MELKVWQMGRMSHSSSAEVLSLLLRKEEMSSREGKKGV
jgi:hypothetical protein